MSDTFEKFEAINSKMNRITEELTKNIGISEELLTTSEDIANVLEEVENKVIPLSEDNEILPASQIAAEVVDISLMKDDFMYMRSMLRDTTENTKRVLATVTEELVYAEDENRASLIMAYSELNKAQMEGIKLFMLSYKEVSNILVNFSKIRKESQTGPTNVYTTNVMNVEATPMNAADIVKSLKGDNK